MNKKKANVHPRRVMKMLLFIVAFSGSIYLLHIAHNLSALDNQPTSRKIVVKNGFSSSANPYAMEHLVIEDRFEAETHNLLEKSTFVDSNNIPTILTEEEISLVVQAVQHEVGTDPNFYLGYDYDFDYIQQCMARVIINRIGRDGFGNTLMEVLTKPKQFMPIENLSSFDPYDERTRRNVLAVINGIDNISNDVLFEMSYKSHDLDRNMENMESQIGCKLSAYFYVFTAEGRMLIFAEKSK